MTDNPFSDPDYLRQNFPPTRQWAEIQGVLFQPVEDGRPPLVSISGTDHKGAETTITARTAVAGTAAP